MKKSQLRQTIKEEISKVSKEEEFTPHGVYTISNTGGFEVMLSDDGDAAKIRDSWGDGKTSPTDWLEIEYITDEEGESNPIIDPEGYNIPLNRVIRNY